jgi:hypothetical protein
MEMMERSVSCTSNRSPFEEKMTPDQLTAIKRREMGRALSDVWFEICKILFPGVALPLNPYAEEMQSETIEGFLAYFEREAQGILAPEIDARMFGDASTIPGQQAFVESVLTDSIRVLLEQIKNGFRSVE